MRCQRATIDACPFNVEDGGAFVARRKGGERGNAFKVVNQCGQLGHLQAELVSPLWPLNAEIDVLSSFSQ